MHLHSYRLQNYRRLRNAHIELNQQVSIFVGANNSGKTSATQALQNFLSGSRERFSLYDFSSCTWQEFNEAGESASDASQEDIDLPAISLDLWFTVETSDLHLVIPLLPSASWEGKQLGMRVRFAASNGQALLQRFREKRDEGARQLDSMQAGAGNYVPWPKSLTDYLERELHHEFEFQYFVLDRTEFDDNYETTNPDYKPKPLSGDQSGTALLKSLVKIDNLGAQRHLADPYAGTGGEGRAEDLSRRLSRFYQRNLEQRGEDHSALKALFDSEEELNAHLMQVFKPTLNRIATLGYPGISNPKLEIKSGLDPTTVMRQDARIHYVLGDGEDAVRLPDSYNGLGFKNLIYMVVEILDVQERWKSEEEARAPLHLIFIEEPEAHLHAQLQQAFIRNILSLLSKDKDDDGVFQSQIVVTTHSPHILYERGFDPIRYFRRFADDGEQSTEVLNLSKFQKGDNPKDRDFLQRYLKLTHCDLFFSDAVILVEGNVERLLLPSMIEKSAKTLRSASICILEVGGAFAHRFKELIEFLGITTLVITDIDSVLAREEPKEEDDEEAEIEFEVPSDDDASTTKKRYGTACLPSDEGAITSNQTLIQWLPKKKTVQELHDATDEDKSAYLSGTSGPMVRVSYQTLTNVKWGDKELALCGRTLEEAFGLENRVWSQAAEQRDLGLRLRGQINSPEALAQGLHRRVKSSNFDKTKFALGVLTRKDEDWIVPSYIREGLEWLRDQVNLEIEQEIEAAGEAVAAPAEAIEATQVTK